MPCGLYGKLPAKRDYLALAVPRPFLEAWEPWLQGGLAASRLALGEDWTAAYLHAPIWRFWLGADIAGAATLGAVMPSADGIGRYFPLTLVARPAGAEPPPPEHDGFEGWFETAEGFLLATLSEPSFDAVTAGLAALPDPAPASAPPGSGVSRLRGGTLLGGADGGGIRAVFARMRPLAAAGLHAGMTHWWTAGGAGFPARAVTSRGLPEPGFFGGMLTGRFDGCEL